MGEWIDLLDPSPDELRAVLPDGLHETDVSQLAAPGPGGRTGFSAHDGHVVGVVLVAVADTATNDVFYHEVDVVLTADRLVTVRKTTPGRGAFDAAALHGAVRPGDSVGRHLYRLMDDVADRYLDLVDDLEQEIGQLEDEIADRPPSDVSLRIRRLRHQLLHVRRTLAPLRDAVRAIADGRIDLAEEVLTRDLEHELAGVHDRLLRAADGLELAHDLLAGARDYFQASVAERQNEIVKRLTAVASILLVPTFIVGLYGQNFKDMPELHWGVWGYVWSWGLIVASTVLQLWYFRRRGWL